MEGRYVPRRDLARFTLVLEQDGHVYLGQRIIIDSENTSDCYVYLAGITPHLNFSIQKG